MRTLRLAMLMAAACMHVASAQDSTTDTAGVHAIDTLAKTSSIEGVRFDSSRISARMPSSTTFDRLRRDDAFDYGREYREPDSWFDRLQEWVLRWLRELLGVKGADTVGSILLYALLGAAVVFVVMKMMGENMRSLFFRRKKERGSASAIDEDVHGIDFADRIARAVSSGDYRLAVRLHFLRLLRDLSDSAAIAWRQSKTNHDYLVELEEPSLRMGFERAALMFEYVWYGDFPVDRESYERIASAIDRVAANAPMHLAPESA